MTDLDLPAVRSLRVESYRGVSGLEVADLSAFSVLVGANDAGKTSVLEALTLLCDPTDLTQWLLLSRCPLGVGVRSAIEGVFPSTLRGSPRKIAVSGDVQNATQRVVVTYQPGPPRVGMWDDAPRAEPLAELEIETRIDNTPVASHSITVHRDALSSGSQWPPGRPMLPVWMVSPSSATVPPLVVAGLSSAIAKGQKRLVLEAMKLLDPQITDINIVTTGTHLILIEHEVRGTVDLRTFGDGLQSALALATRLACVTDGLLLVDEIWGAIHTRALPTLLRWLMQAAARARVQVVATTHSLDCLTALAQVMVEQPELTSRVAVHRIQRGRPETVRYDGTEVKVAVEAELEIR